MLVQYLEWSTFGEDDSEWPLSSLTATTIDDQSGYTPEEWPGEVIVDLDSSTTRSVPASFLNEFMRNIQDSYDQSVGDSAYS